MKKATKYLFDCHKCTNVYVSGANESWCKPMVDGKEGTCHIVSGTCGKDFIFACDHYTTENRQMELYPWGKE